MAADIRVLLVEDEAILANALRFTLEDGGVLVVGIASEAREAMGLFRAASPQIVLMDIRIRGNVDGIEVARQMKEERPGVDIIFLTGNADQTTLARAWSILPLEVLVKPVRLDTLLAVVRRAGASAGHGS